MSQLVQRAACFPAEIVPASYVLCIQDPKQNRHVGLRTMISFGLVKDGVLSLVRYVIKQNKQAMAHCIPTIVNYVD